MKPELKKAIEEGNFQAVIDLIEKLEQQNKQDSEYLQEAFVLACKIGRLKIAKYLHSQGARIHTSLKDISQGLESPLTAAIKNQNLELIQWLLSQGAVVNTSWLYFIFSQPSLVFPKGQLDKLLYTLALELRKYFQIFQGKISNPIQEKIRLFKLLIQLNANLFKLYDSNNSNTAFLNIARSSVALIFLEDLSSLDAKNNPSYYHFLKLLNEARHRIFLAHRFGLNSKTTLSGFSFSLEGVDPINSLFELRKAYQGFSIHYDHSDHSDHSDSKQRIQRIFDSVSRDYPFIFTQNKIKNLRQAVLVQIEALTSPLLVNEIAAKLNTGDLIIIPTKTKISTEDNPLFHLEAISFFDHFLSKMNRGLFADIPGIQIYRQMQSSPKKVASLLFPLIHSLETPLEGNAWRTALDGLLENPEEPTKTIRKKRQAVGNCSWATAKLMVYNIIYAVTYKFCKTENLSDDLCATLSESIANPWYKLFTHFDREKALQDYIEIHEKTDPSQITDETIEIEILEEIFLKLKRKKEGALEKKHLSLN